MRDLSLSTASFPTAWCDSCDKGVLTYVMIDERRDESRFCVHCDRPVETRLRWVSAGELEAWGYYFGAMPLNHKSGSACGSCQSCGINGKH